MRPFRLLIVAAAVFIMALVQGQELFTKAEFLAEVRRQTASTAYREEFEDLVMLAEKAGDPNQLMLVAGNQRGSVKTHALLYILEKLPKVWKPKEGEQRVALISEGYTFARDTICSWDPAFRQVLDEHKKFLQREAVRRGEKVGKFVPPTPAYNSKLDAGLGGNPTPFDQGVILRLLGNLAVFEILQEEDPGLLPDFYQRIGKS